jgi:uncharacterized protein YgiM (DUF1202 family)
MRTRTGHWLSGLPGPIMMASLRALPLVVVLLLAAVGVCWSANHSQPVQAASPRWSALAVTVTATNTVILTSTPTITPTPGMPPADSTPMATDLVIPAAQPVVTATTNVNVREGPGVAYPAVGYLAEGQLATVTGISADARWLQIIYPPLSDKRGWVSRRYVTAADLTRMPVVEAPPLVLPPTPTPTPTPTMVPTRAPTPVAISGWLGEYYSNLYLNGPPSLVRDDAAVDFSWGGLSPGPGLPNDDFSARWTRIVTFDASTYHFTVEADDGVRVWLDGNLIIDEWHDTRPKTYATDVWISAGPHSLRVEYYEHLGSALVRLAWRKPDAWKARYYGNRKLKDKAILERYEDIDHDWGQGSPDPVVPADNFSARWTRNVDFDEGTYVFAVEVDDGARLWIDDQLLIDGWQDGSRTYWAEKHFDDDGEHAVRVEYYEHYGAARIKVRWGRQ